MLNGITRLRIDSMGVFLTALIVEITVVTTGSHRLIGNSHNALNLLTCALHIVLRLRNTYAPRFLIGVQTTGNNLATNLDHKVINALATQQFGHYIGTVTLGNSRAVEHDAIIGLTDLTFFEGNLLIANNLHQTIYLLFRGFDTILKAKAPGINQRGNGDIESTISLLRDVHRQFIHI